MKKPIEVLNHYWGYSSFRPLQEDIINALLRGSDVLAMMPTGGGKSVCYQVPALCFDGICIVVSPLIALMKDQVQNLKDKNIKAACLVSGMSRNEQDVVLNNALYGKTKLLYISPERMKSQLFINQFRNMNVSFIAVDEAHCISEWGYDFRPPYLELAFLRSLHPNVPILALTASATPKVADDIQEKLQFKSSAVFRGGFYRDNLSYMIFKEDDKYGRLLNICRNLKDSGIVYVRNRRRASEISHYLNQQGISSTFYHAGLPPAERDVHQSVWMKGTVRVMVATNAFGMGIDKGDVRFVVHLDIPQSIEVYYQEAGRAGRDGLPSYAIMLYDDYDLKQCEDGFRRSFPKIEYIRNVYSAICNFYQIPVGSGAGSEFPYDIEKICSSYKFNVAEYFSATHFLEREGLISISDTEELVSKVYIPVSKETLYRFQVENVLYDDLISILLRMYGGLFSDFIPISERKIAERAMILESRVVKMLQHLDACNIIMYKKKHPGPRIFFTSERIDSQSISLADAKYNQLKQNAETRLKAMLNFVTSVEDCRSSRLLSYFGEEGGAKCSMCDVCRAERDSKTKADVSERILQLLDSSAMSMKTLASHFPDIDEQQLVQTVRQLIDLRKIGVNDKLELYR